MDLNGASSLVFLGLGLGLLGIIRLRVGYGLILKLPGLIITQHFILLVWEIRITPVMTFRWVVGYMSDLLAIDG